MSPELEEAVEILESKAKRPRSFDEQSIVEALHHLGAESAAKTLSDLLQQAVQHDDQVRAEALIEAKKLRKLLSR